jgi:putative membrane protein
MSPDLCALTTAVIASHHAGWMWLWGGLMLVVWAAIIGTLFWMVLLPTGPDQPPPPGEARKVLDERFARGEIDAPEYFDRLEALERGRAGRRDGDRVDA